MNPELRRLVGLGAAAWAAGGAHHSVASRRGNLQDRLHRRVAPALHPAVLLERPATPRQAAKAESASRSDTAGFPLDLFRLPAAPDCCRTSLGSSTQVFRGKEEVGDGGSDHMSESGPGPGVLFRRSWALGGLQHAPSQHREYGGAVKGCWSLRWPVLSGRTQKA